MQYRRFYFLSFLIFFIFLPFLVEAKEIDPSEFLQLPDRDDANIIGTIPDQMTISFVDKVSSGDTDFERIGILLIARTAARQRMAKYFLREAPIEVLSEVIKAGIEIYALYQTGDIGQIISKIEKMTVKEARNYVTEWLLENETKASSGFLTFQYDSYDGSKSKYSAPYLILYKSLGENNGVLLIKIYCPDSLKSPASQGSVGGMTGIVWFSEKTQIPPFILTMRGKVHRTRAGYWKGEITHDYKWIGKPEITIEFPEK
ncbi:hypothetical protein J7J74_01500, partial [bacterium]|nr:hypothetical protein [bacterium]